MLSESDEVVMTREEVLRHFELAGWTVTAWAREHSFKPVNVYSVLAGRTHGRRGEAHRIAIALKLKPVLPVEAFGRFGVDLDGSKPMR